MEDTAELILTDQSPSQHGEELYVNKDMLSGDMEITGAGKEENKQGTATLHYAKIDFFNVQNKGKEQGVGVIRGSSQKTTDYAEIRHESQSNRDVSESKAGLQDEEGEYAEVLRTGPAAETKGRKGATLSDSGASAFERGLQPPCSTENRQGQTELVEEHEAEEEWKSQDPTESVEEATYGNICQQLSATELDNTPLLRATSLNMAEGQISNHINSSCQVSTEEGSGENECAEVRRKTDVP
ncbi:B-cell receptor CD22-like [Arapaima gigas]